MFVELVLGTPEIVIDYNKEKASYVINWQPIIRASSYQIEEKLGGSAWQEDLSHSLKTFKKLKEKNDFFRV